MVAMKEDPVVEKPQPDISSDATSGSSEVPRQLSSSISPVGTSSAVTDVINASDDGNGVLTTTIDTAHTTKEGSGGSISSVNDGESSDKALVSIVKMKRTSVADSISMSSPNATTSTKVENLSAPDCSKSADNLDVTTAMETNAEEEGSIANLGHTTNESSISQLSSCNDHIGDAEVSEKSAAIESSNLNIPVSSQSVVSIPVSSVAPCTESLTATNQTCDISVAQKDEGFTNPPSVLQNSTSTVQNLTTTSSQLVTSHSNDTTATSDALSSEFTSTPGTLHEENPSSSPSKALSLLVGYGASSDSEDDDDDKMDTDADTPNVLSSSREVASLPSPRDVESSPSSRVVASSPSPREVASSPSPREVASSPSPREVASSPSSREVDSLPSSREVDSLPSSREVAPLPMDSAAAADDVVEMLPTSTLTNGHCINGTDSTEDNTKNLLIIDVESDKYRYTIDIGSGTDDSETDSDCSSSSSASSSTVSSSSDESSDSEEDLRPVHKKKDMQDPKNKPEREKTTSKKKRNNVLTPGEISMDDLPPIEDLKISVTEDQAHVIGFILNIVAQQVVVQGHHGIPPIDLDSVLFLDNGKRSLGQIFDVFGHVQEPLYVVRFNSADHIKESEIKIGEPVYFAPSTEHTTFVVIDELMRIKGSDASGLTGNEPQPAEVTDFSDDDEEAMIKGFSKQSKYNSSTNEFQSSRKRSRNQGRDRGDNRGGGRGRGQFCNPFSERGMRPRARNHYNQPPAIQQRFDPSFPPGPSRFPVGPPGHAQGGPPFMVDNRNFGSRPFSPFTNQVDMNCSSGQDINLKPHVGECYQNGYPLSSSPWSQPASPWSQQGPPSQFGGPPQFPSQRPCFPPPGVSVPPSTPPPHCPPSYSPGTPHHQSFDIQNMGPPGLPSCPPAFSPRPPHHPSVGFQNMGPPSPCPVSFPPRPPHHPPGGFQNNGPPTSPCPPIFSTPPAAFQNMGPPPPVDHALPPAGSVNGGWFPPGPPSHPPPPSPHGMPPQYPPPPSSPHQQYRL